MLSNFDEDCRAAGHRAYSHIALANHALLTIHPTSAFAGVDLVRDAFKKLVGGMQDNDTSVVIHVLNYTSAFLGLVSANDLTKHVEELLGGIKVLISGQAASQLTMEDDSVDAMSTEEKESTVDELIDLIEAVGDVVEAMARSLRGYFAQHFSALLHHMMSNLYKEAGPPSNK
eukprot:GFKZ01008565.1.p1 GENE.GFKZ01008565.1~~GFKZ01008565.1.p1  ORF type:complete len:173 (-),score=32.66 GFKZ01008565.1:1455-1973(-)